MTAVRQEICLTFAGEPDSPTGPLSPSGHAMSWFAGRTDSDGTAQPPVPATMGLFLYRGRLAAAARATAALAAPEVGR